MLPNTTLRVCVCVCVRAPSRSSLLTVMSFITAGYALQMSQLCSQPSGRLQGVVFE